MPPTAAVKAPPRAVILEMHFTEVQRQKLALVQETIDQLVGEIECIEVRSVEDAANLNNLLGQVKVAHGEIEHSRTGQVSVLNVIVKAINDIWRKPKDVLEEAEKVAKKKLIVFYQGERERQQREAEAAQRAQQEAADREAEALAKLQAAKTPVDRRAAEAEVQAASADLTVARLAEPTQELRGIKSDGADLGMRVSSTLQERWTFKVVNAAMIPREYMVADEKKIRQAVLAGARDIPGVSIYAEESLATRVG
jgi:hypothetical protein